MIETISQAFAAGETKTFMVRGEYFETIDAPSSGLDVILSDRGGAQVSALRAIGSGVYVRPGIFEVVQITSASAQTVIFFVADGDAGTRRMSGNVTVIDQISPTCVQASVTSGSAQLVAANAARRYLMIQNKDSTGSIWINFGVPATQVAGYRIGPGDFYEPLKIPVTQIRAIGDLANNPNIAVIEG